MTQYGFRPTSPEAPQFKSIINPFWRLTLDVRDLENTKYYNFTTWTKSLGSNYTDSSDMYANYTGLSSAQASSLDLTKTIYLDETGYYLIFLRVSVDPSNSGKVKLYIDDQQIWNEINCTGSKCLKTMMFPVAYYQKGNHSFKVNITKQAYVCEIIIYPIKRYVATNDKSGVEKRTNPIDVLNVDFTENGVAESNILTANITLEDHLFNETNESILFTELSDSISLELGHTYQSAVPKFGGYVIAPTLSDEIIQLKCMDRMMDLVIQSRWSWAKNVCIGTPPDNTYTQYASVYDMGEYFTKTAEYNLNFIKLYSEDILAFDYSNIKEYNKTSAISGYSKSFKDSSGIQINPLSATTDGEFVLWQSPYTYDAKIYDGIGFDYNFGVFNTPLPITVSVYMHKAGQTLSQAVKYNIQFNGETTLLNEIGSVTANTSNAWQWFSFDLKTAFDAITPSSEYNISKISISGVVTSGMASSPSTYGMMVNTLFAYRVINDAPQFSNSDVKTHFEGLQKLCEETKYIAYIIPSRDRAYDNLYIAPQGSTISPVNIEENVNLIDVNTWDYDPIGDGICNSRSGIYSTTSAPDTKIYVYNEDIESIKKYRRIKTEEELSEVHTANDATASVNKFVTEHKIKKIGAEITVDGNVLFSPTQYVLTNIGSKRLRGNYQIKGINQKLDIENNYFETTLGINRLPGRFKQRQRLYMNFLKNQKPVLY